MPQEPNQSRLSIWFTFQCACVPLSHCTRLRIYQCCMLNRHSRRRASTMFVRYSSVDPTRLQSLAPGLIVDGNLQPGRAATSKHRRKEFGLSDLFYKYDLGYDVGGLLGALKSRRVPREGHKKQQQPRGCWALTCIVAPSHPSPSTITARICNTPLLQLLGAQQ